MLDKEDLLAIAQLMAEQEARIMRGVNVIIEEKVSKEIRTIAEGHKDILKRLPETAAMEELTEEVDVHNSAILNLKKRVEVLEKAQ